MDATTAFSAIGAAGSLVAIAAVFVQKVIQRLTSLEGQVDAVDGRLTGVQEALVELRVDVARSGQKLDDHLADERAHLA